MHPASVTAMMPPEASEMATFLPRAMLQPSHTSMRVVKGAVPARERSSSRVPSREPPSTTTTSSGSRDWPVMLDHHSPRLPASFSTVATRVTCSLAVSFAADNPYTSSMI